MREQHLTKQKANQRKLVVVNITKDWLASDGPLDAWIFDENRVLLESRTIDDDGVPFNAEELAPQYVAILSGSLVTSTSAVIPPKYLRRHRQSLPYLFEEIVLGEPHDQHFAIGEPKLNGAVDVAIVDKATIEAIVQRLVVRGVFLGAMYTDVGLLPDDEHSLYLMDAGSEVLFRCGSDLGVLPANSVLLPELIGRTADSDVEIIIGGNVPLHSDVAHRLLALPNGVARYLLERAISECDAINLLQQEFAPKETAPSVSATVWVVAALCFSLLCVAVYFLIMSTTIDEEAAQQRRVEVSAVREFIPSFRAGRDVREEVAQYLQDRFDARDVRLTFSEFMGRFSAAWLNAGLEGPTIKTLRFSRTDSEVMIEIDGIDVPEVDRLQAALGEDKLASSVVSVTASQQMPEKSLARLRISVGSLR